MRPQKIKYLVGIIQKDETAQILDLQEEYQPQSGHNTISGTGKSIGCNFIYTAITSGTKDHSFSPDNFNFTCLNITYNHTIAPVTIDHQRMHIPLIINFNGLGVFYKLLVKSM